jgi:hypothetical protein
VNRKASRSDLIAIITTLPNSARCKSIHGENHFHWKYRPLRRHQDALRAAAARTLRRALRSLASISDPVDTDRTGGPASADVDATPGAVR